MKNQEEIIQMTEQLYNSNAGKMNINVCALNAINTLGDQEDLKGIYGEYDVTITDLATQIATTITERMRKKKFVEEFGELLAKYDVNSIQSAKYYIDHLGNEIVEISFGGDHSYITNVNCDSISAIIRDVMKGL